MLGTSPDNGIERRDCSASRVGSGTRSSHHQDRLTTPLIRKDGEFVEASWDEALDYVADRLAQYDGGQFATLASAKATNEDGYIQQKFAAPPDEVEQHRPLHAPVPFAVGRGDARLTRQRRHQQLVCRLRRGGAASS